MQETRGQIIIKHVVNTKQTLKVKKDACGWQQGIDHFF